MLHWNAISFPHLFNNPFSFSKLNLLVLIFLFFITVFLFSLDSSRGFRRGSVQPRGRLVVFWRYVVLTGDRRGQGRTRNITVAIIVVLFTACVFLLLHFTVSATSRVGPHRHVEEGHRFPLRPTWDLKLFFGLAAL